MSVYIKRLYDENCKETGAILSVVADAQKNIEQLIKLLIQHAQTKLYPDQGLNIYKSVDIDTPSIVVIININDLKYEIHTLI